MNNTFIWQCEIHMSPPANHRADGWAAGFWKVTFLNCCGSPLSNTIRWKMRKMSLMFCLSRCDNLFGSSSMRKNNNKKKTYVAHKHKPPNPDGWQVHMMDGWTDGWMVGTIHSLPNIVDDIAHLLPMHAYPPPLTHLVLLKLIWNWRILTCAQSCDSPFSPDTFQEPLRNKCTHLIAELPTLPIRSVFSQQSSFPLK